MNQEKIRNTYLRLKELNEKILEDLRKKQLMISLLRLLVFLAGIFLTVTGFIHSTAAGISSLVISILLFLFLVKRSSDYTARIVLKQNLVKINNDELNALDVNYSAFDGGIDLADTDHDFSNDIDLFGEDSLFRYLNRTVTFSGRSQLAEWLSEPYKLRDEITERQEAVSELAGKLDWRQHFMACGIGEQTDKDNDSFNEWLNEKESIMSSPVMKALSYILPSTEVALLLLTVAGFMPVRIIILFFILNLFLTGLFVKKSNRIHAMVSRKHLFLASVGSLIRSFENEKFSSPVLIDMQLKLYADKGSAADKIRELDKIIRAFDSRLNLFVGFILNGLLLWDFHCLMKLEKWKASTAVSFPEWMNLLGKADGFGSLANYSYNNPDYSFPEVIENGSVIDAVAMGHPLLKRSLRVNNDFSVGHHGQVFIITGANMSGKSTFLRTVAINLVLAMTGAPACAERMCFSPVKLFTSMRTTDSLSHNESYFYAELKRLKILKERLESEKNIFFILDEILKGTNSNDKSLGSRLFLKRIIELGGTGLIATHDISLGEMESEFPENVVNKCFEIEIDGENISFDYLIHNGITRKMNAAVLMRQMGIA
jgi:hypothetical protein